RPRPPRRGSARRPPSSAAASSRPPRRISPAGSAPSATSAPTPPGVPSPRPESGHRTIPQAVYNPEAMGLEATCRVRFGKKASEGKAKLETADLFFRGAFRLQIPFKDVKSATAKDGELVVVWPEGEAAFALGRDAGKWALKIRYPRGLLD